MKMSCRRRRLKNKDDMLSVQTGRRRNSDYSPIGTTAPTTITENDKKAVEWWRSHQQGSAIDSNNEFIDKREQVGTASKGSNRKDKLNDQTLPYDISPPNDTLSFANTLENSQPRAQEMPYGSPQQLLTKPQNGMILDHKFLPKENGNRQDEIENPSLGIFRTKGRSDSDDGTNRMEFFQPEVVPTSRQILSQDYLSSSPFHRREKLTTEQTGDKSKGEEESDDFILFPEEDKKPRKETLSEFIARKSNTSRTETPNEIEFSDHLSDIPSDVDSITRDRYLLACKMLKMSIIQKESALIPIEKKYIMSLLDDFESQSLDGSDLSEDHINSIERAILQLENDSKSSYDNSNTDLPSPTTAARAQRIRKTGSVARAETSLPSRNDKNPHTATRKPKKFMEHIPNPCNPINSTKIFGKKRNLHHEESQVMKNNFVSKNTRVHSNGNTERLVRFDGWSFQNSMEYPFLLLDAGGDNINPRVFTPGMMEALRSFMPFRVMDHNFWLRFSLARDGASFATLLASVRASPYTMIGVETDRGDVFGSFTGRPWRIGSKWYGTSEAFLWRLKQNRYTSPRNSRDSNFEREIEVYPCTEDDDLIQYCTAKTIAVGGGEWQYGSCPYADSGQGMGLVIDGDLAGGETNSCATFANPKLARYASSSSEFVISNLEVWSLTPCMNVEDATKTEMREFFVEGYNI